MSGRAQRRRGLVAPLLVAALALTACVAPAEGLPPGVSVTLTQLRSDVAERRMQVRVHNGTASAIEVEHVTVADRRFIEPAQPVHERSTTISPGRAVALPVTLGPAACRSPVAIDATVTLRFRYGGDLRTATVAAREDFAFLADLHGRECLAERLAASARIAFGAFTPSAPGEPATLELEVAPRGRGQEAPRLVAIRETNLLSYRQADATATAFPLGVAADAPARVALPLVPGRCDPHAVQEDKRGTVFTLDVEVDGHPGTIQLAASPQLRADILTWVSEWCAG